MNSPTNFSRRSPTAAITILLDALDQLTEAGLVSRRGAGRDAIFIFKHAFIQHPRTAPCCAAREWNCTPVSGERWKSNSRISRRRSPKSLARHFASAGLIDAAVPHLAKGRGAGAAAFGECGGFGAFDERHNAPCLAARRGGAQTLRELRLQMALGSATRAIKGHAAPETLQVYSRARELLDETVPAKEQMAILYGHWSVSIIPRRVLSTGLAVARQSLALTAGERRPRSDRIREPDDGDITMGAGEFADAVPHLERAVRLYAPGSGNKTDLRYSQDHAVWALSMLGLTLWPLGYPDKARDAAATALIWAGEIQHAMTTGFALCFGLALWGQSGIDPSPSGDLGEAAIAYCLEHDPRAYIPWARFYRGLKLVRPAEYAEGLEEMDAAIECRAKNPYEDVHAGAFGGSCLGPREDRRSGIGIIGVCWPRPSKT